MASGKSPITLVMGRLKSRVATGRAESSSTTTADAFRALFRSGECAFGPLASDK